MGMVRGNRVLVVQLQGADKGCAQLGEEVKRPSEKCHVAADRFSAGKTADRLVDHCLKDGRGKVFL